MSVHSETTLVLESPCCKLSSVFVSNVKFLRLELPAPPALYRRFVREDFFMERFEFDREDRRRRGDLRGDRRRMEGKVW